MSDHVGEEEHVRSCWEKCDHVSFCIVITGAAMYVRKVTHTKLLKMVILEEQVKK